MSTMGVPFSGSCLSATRVEGPVSTKVENVKPVVAQLLERNLSPRRVGEPWRPRTTARADDGGRKGHACRDDGGNGRRYRDEPFFGLARGVGDVRAARRRRGQINAGDAPTFAGLSSAERAQVHEAARKLGLGSRSEGSDASGTRAVTVFPRVLPGEWRGPAARATIRAPPPPTPHARTRLATTSTTSAHSTNPCRTSATRPSICTRRFASHAARAGVTLAALRAHARATTARRSDAIPTTPLPGAARVTNAAARSVSAAGCIATPPCAATPPRTTPSSASSTMRTTTAAMTPSPPPLPNQPNPPENPTAPAPTPRGRIRRWTPRPLPSVLRATRRETRDETRVD